jgi:DNA-binding GntR family transcriptional regulator
MITFDLGAGDRIPTEAEIGAHYGLSRITVRQAVTSLVDEGLLLRQQGRGTFVRLARREVPLGDAGHFLASAFDAPPPGRVTLHAAEAVPCPNWLASRLAIAAGAPVHKVRRLLERDGGVVGDPHLLRPCLPWPQTCSAPTSFRRCTWCWSRSSAWSRKKPRSGWR